MITDLVKVNPGGTLKIPPDLQAKLAKFGLSGNIVNLLKALGLQGIGVLGPYDFESDFIVPTNLTGVDLKALMAGVSPSDQFILSSILERWLGPLPGAATPQPPAGTPQP